MDESKRHSFLYAKAGSNDAARDSEVYQDSRSFDTSFSLQDPSLLAGRSEFPDGITLVILALYPNLILQQISNTLAVRQIVTHGRSEEHTSELQSLMRIPYAVFCLKKKQRQITRQNHTIIPT